MGRSIRRTEEAAAVLDVRIHRLPAVEPPTDHAGSMEFISQVVQLHAPHIRAAVSSLVCPVAALVLDLFWSPLVVVARELGVPAYCTSTATPRRSPNYCACRRCARRWPASSGRWTARRTFPGCPQCRRSRYRRRSWNWKGRSPNADGIIVNTARRSRASSPPSPRAGACAGPGALLRRYT